MSMFLESYCVCQKCACKSDSIPISDGGLYPSFDEECTAKILEKLEFFHVRTEGNDQEGAFGLFCKKCASDFNDRGYFIDFMTPKHRIIFYDNPTETTELSGAVSNVA